MNKIIDVDKERRNFPGYDKNQYYSLADMQEKYRYEQAGTTDTDFRTHTGYEGGANNGYAKIYQKHGKGRSKGGQGLGMKVKMDKNARVG